MSKFGFAIVGRSEYFGVSFLVRETSIGEIMSCFGLRIEKCESFVGTSWLHLVDVLGWEWLVEGISERGCIAEEMDGEDASLFFGVPEDWHRVYFGKSTHLNNFIVIYLYFACMDNKSVDNSTLITNLLKFILETPS